MRAKWTTMIALAAMAALVAAPAFAQHETEAFADTEVDSLEAEVDSADRALIHAYDPEAMQLLWEIAMEDDECEVDDEATYTYEIDEEGNVVVNTEGEGEEEGDPLEGCEFNATDVTGPNGQVNHGTVVSAFVKALKEEGITGAGCYVKIIAGTDYGKGDQQVKVSDVEDEEETTTSEPEGTEAEEPTEIGFTVSETTCGKPDHAGPPEDKGKPEGKGKPAWAGQGKDHPDHPANGKGRP